MDKSSLLGVIILFLINIQCVSTHILYTPNGKDQYFSNLIRKIQVNRQEEKDFKRLQLTEVELLERDLKFIKLLNKQDHNSKWHKKFFVVNKIDGRQRDLLRLKTRGKLPSNYEILDYPALDDEKEAARKKAAPYFYDRGMTSLASLDKSKRHEVRKIYYQLDSVNIFESSYKDVDSTLADLGEIAVTKVKINGPKELLTSITQFGNGLNIPWTHFTLDSTATGHIEVNIKESTPALQKFRDTLIACIVAPKNQHDSLQEALYFDSQATIASIRGNSPVGLVYANLLVKQAKYCYSVDWKLLDQKDPYLFEVCDEFENIYKTFSYTGNRKSINKDTCPEIATSSSNLSDLGAIGKAKQLAIRKLFDHIGQVVVEIDQ